MAGKRKGFPVFWTFFVLFVVCMAIFWIWVISYVKKCLVIYEDSQPEHVIEDIISQMEDGSIYDRMSFASGSSRFEAGNIYKNSYIAGLEGKTFTYEKSSRSYDAKMPVYKIYADDVLAAEVTLLEVSSERLMLILSKQEWKIGNIEPIYETGKQNVTIVAPDTYSIFINDMKMDARELTGMSWELAEFRYAREYTAVPKLVEYSVKGLLEEPRITVYDNMGRQVEYAVDAAGNIRVDSFAPVEMDEELAAQVLKNAKDYSNFFSKDIEGCRESVAPIAGMFPENSYYLELAENYRLNDMWMYSAHETPVFANERVSNYIAYTPDFFSVEIYFEKNMILTLNGEARQDITNTRFYYAKAGDKWVIVDMQAIIE